MLKSLTLLTLGLLAVGCAAEQDRTRLMGSRDRGGDETTEADESSKGDTMSVDEWKAQSNVTGNELASVLAEPSNTTVQGQGFIGGFGGSITRIVSSVNIASIMRAQNLSQIGFFNRSLFGANDPNDLFGHGSALLSNLTSKPDVSAPLPPTQEGAIVNLLLAAEGQAAVMPSTSLMRAEAQEELNLASAYGGTPDQYRVYVPSDFTGSSITLTSRQFVKITDGERKLVGFTYVLNGTATWIGIGN